MQAGGHDRIKAKQRLAYCISYHIKEAKEKKEHLQEMESITNKFAIAKSKLKLCIRFSRANISNANVFGLVFLM